MRSGTRASSRTVHPATSQSKSTLTLTYLLLLRITANSLQLALSKCSNVSEMNYDCAVHMNISVRREHTTSKRSFTFIHIYLKFFHIVSAHIYLSRNL